MIFDPVVGLLIPLLLVGLAVDRVATASNQKTYDDSTDPPTVGILLRARNSRVDALKTRQDHPDYPALVKFHEAVAEGNISVAKTLMQENPALINLDDFSGRTALHIATETGSIPMVKLLLHQCARQIVWNIRNHQSPLDIAINSSTPGLLSAFFTEKEREAEYNQLCPFID